MLILFFVSSSLEYWSVNHTSISENAELNLFKTKHFLREISSNLSNNLMGTNV